MSDWLKTLLGVEDSEIPDGAVTSFEFANVPGGSAGLLMLLVAAALVAGVFWVYRREGSASPRVKYGLAALRALVLLCAFVLILEPVLAVDQIEEVDKSTILLLDDSLSMTTKDRYLDPVARAELANALEFREAELSGKTRAQLVNRAVGATGVAAALARQNRVYVFRYSDGIAAHATLPRLGAGQAAPPVPGIDPGAADNKRAVRGTNLAGAIRQAVEEVGSDRVAAIVVVGDGRTTLGPPPEDVALFLNNKALPLHTVVVGESEPPRNLRAIALAGPDRVFRNDPVALEAQISGQGLAGATAELERRYAEGGGDWERVGSHNVVLPVGGAPVPLKFQDRPPRVGVVEYRLRVEKDPQEFTHLDNEKIFVTRVIEEKAKVLLVSGGPAHEYYAIKNVLLRDRTVTLACYLQSARPEFAQDGNDVSLRELPADEKTLFQFDVVLLHDPNGAQFPTDWPALLKKFVAEHRGGLAFIAGNKHTIALLRSSVNENDLTGILPVVLDLDRADMPGSGIGYGAYFKTPWRMVPEAAALTHPATRFHSDPEQARELVWRRLPPFFWFFPVRHAKPGATVLARHESPRENVEPYGQRPIIAVHRYGGGHVMFLAADETHRWRATAEPVFDRFWVQTVRYLMEGRFSGERRRFRLHLDREVIDLGDAAQIRAEVFDETFEPLDAASVEVLVNGPGDLEEIVELVATPERPGTFSGSYAPPGIGDYELRAADPQYRPKGAADTPGATFVTALPDREMGDVRADKGLLKDLAARARGISVPLSGIARIGDAKLIPPASERVVTQGRPVPLWDTWTTILLVLGLLCAEWILRKLHRMV